MSIIHIANHGPLITSTNYWDSELALAGKLYCSVNAGAIRILLPPAMYGALADMNGCEKNEATKASDCPKSRLGTALSYFPRGRFFLLTETTYERNL